MQQVRGQQRAALRVFRDRALHPQFQQFPDLLVGAAARRDRQLGALPPCLSDGFQGRGEIPEGNGERTRFPQARCLQQARLAAVTEQHRFPRFPCLANDRRVRLQGCIRDASALQHAGDILSHVAEAAEQHVPGARRCRWLRPGVQVRCVVQQQFLQQAVVPHQQRRTQHGEDDRRDDGLPVFKRHHLVLQGQEHQCQPEFAALAEHHAQPQGGTHGMVTQQRQAADEQALTDDDPWQEQQQPGPIAWDHPDVQVHADADEEHTHQHVSERPQVVLDLVPVLRVAEEDAGQYGAQGGG